MSDGDFITCDDLLEHAKEQKENFFQITKSTLNKAVKEVFGGISVKSRIRTTQDDEKSRVYVFTNLKIGSHEKQ